MKAKIDERHAEMEAGWDGYVRQIPGTEQGQPTQPSISLCLSWFIQVSS